MLGGFTMDADRLFGPKDDDLFSWFRLKNGGIDLSCLFGNRKGGFKHFDVGHHDWS